MGALSSRSPSPSSSLGRSSLFSITVLHSQRTTSRYRRTSTLAMWQLQQLKFLPTLLYLSLLTSGEGSLFLSVASFSPESSALSQPSSRPAQSSMLFSPSRPSLGQPWLSMSPSCSPPNSTRLGSGTQQWVCAALWPG